jgi:chorismate-pyruvate lyase
LALIVAMAIAGVALLASHSQAASASVASGPRVEMALARQHVTAGHRAGLTYLASGVPSGGRVYLEVRLAGTGRHWLLARRLHRAGTVTAPALRAGSYWLRTVIVRGGRVLAASARSHLTVSAASSSHFSLGSLAWLGKAALLLIGYLLG